MSADKITSQTQYLTADELIKRWRGKIASKTLANWRSSKQGPTFCKPCGSPLYPLESVIEYERLSKFN